jgi:hypothetical protein
VFPPPTCVIPCSALRFVLTPTMASADFCISIPIPLDIGSTEVSLGTHADLPGYCAPTFTLMPVGYTPQRSVQVSGFDDICRLTPLRRLISASCSSGQRFAFSFLRIRSHPRHPCRLANTSPCRVCRGLPPPNTCALPGAQIETAPESRRRFPLGLLVQRDGITCRLCRQQYFPLCCPCKKQLPKCSSHSR